jgi:chitinase
MFASRVCPGLGSWLAAVGVAALVGCQSGGGSGDPSGAAGAGVGGMSGASGVAGRGTAGTAGVAGASGAAGVAGSGAAGTTGAAGASGTAGAGGVAGANGTAGASGVAGASGSAGASGVAGANGAAGTSGAAGAAGPLVFGPYKDTSINMNWNTNVVSTKVSGDLTTFVSDMSPRGAGAVTLAFATGECGGENWGGVPGADLASANLPLLKQAGLRYLLSTGGAAGSFSCGSDAGMTTFLERWMSPNLVGVDFDIEGGQTPAVLDALVARVKAAHVAYPKLRFSFTLATLAPSATGVATAASLGAAAPDGFNVYGDQTLAAIKSALGFTGAPATWPGYATINLMVMDYGSAGVGNCVVSNGACQMGQSAIQAAYNLRDKWGVPFAGIELTPMIGGNDATSETFTLADVDTVAHFATTQHLAGVHYWSYDRDVDCPPGYAQPTCNSVGGAGAHGYLNRFAASGLK